MALDCPVFTFFFYRDSETGNYHGIWEELPVSRSGGRQSRREEIKKMANEYAKRIESVCCAAPDQWFNFFDVWKKAA